MRIRFEDVLDFVSINTEIDKKDITFDASFAPANVDMGRNYDKDFARTACIQEYYRNKSQGLLFSVYAKGYEIFRFYADDIEPHTNDICDLMRVSTVQSCIGSGFYSNYPYLILDGKCDKKDVKKFIESVSFDPEQTEVVDYPVESEEHEAFIESLPQNAISESFFEDIEAVLNSESTDGPCL